MFSKVYELEYYYAFQNNKMTLLTLKAIIFAGLVVVLLAAPQSSRICPRIINRLEWGAIPAVSPPLTTFPPTHVIIHNTNGESCTNVEKCAALLRYYQIKDMNAGELDIAQNFVIGEDGNVYEGRGWGKQPVVTAPNYGGKSVGIAFLGAFEDRLPSATALQAAHDLFACGVADGKISASYKLVGHRQVQDFHCPGNTLFNDMKGWPHFSTTP